MIIEDVGEKEDSKHYVGNILKKRCSLFKREEFRIDDERVGDYIGIHDGNIMWMVERKRNTDFVKSVKEGRMDKQLEKMARLYKGVKYLIFEGSWTQTLKDHYYFYSKLQSMKIKCAWYGVSFIECKDEEATASFLLLLEKYCEKFQEIKIESYKPNIVRADDQRLIPLMACKGVGKKTAKLLIDEFESLDVIVALAINKPDVILSVKGIGNKVLNGILEIFTKKEMVLSEKENIGNRGDGSDIQNNGKGRSKIHGRSKTPYINSASVCRRRKVYSNAGRK